MVELDLPPKEKKKRGYWEVVFGISGILEISSFCFWIPYMLVDDWVFIEKATDKGFMIAREIVAWPMFYTLALAIYFLLASLFVRLILLLWRKARNSSN